MDLIVCDGVALKNPSTYDITYADLDSSNSYTSETGVLVRDRIRANQRTIAVSWDKLTLAELSSIMQRVSTNSSVSLTFLDYYSGGVASGRFYVDNRAGTAKKIRTLTNGYFSLSFNFIEY